jgi:predicted nucleic acid-binding protein
LSPKRWKQPPRGVVDTSVLVAGISGFRDELSANPSATLIAAWTEAPTFVWLLTEEILSEYVEVLERLHVRSARTIVALIREQGQLVRILKKIPDLPDRDDAPFCECAESADADFIVTLNPTDFPQSRLNAKDHFADRPTSPAPAQGTDAPQTYRDPQEVVAPPFDARARNKCATIGHGTPACHRPPCAPSRIGPPLPQPLLSRCTTAS